MPQWISVAWAVLLVTGAGTSLVGIFWRTIPVGFLIEGAGRTMLWPASLAYSTVVWHFEKDYMGAGVVALFGVACYIRAVYVRHVHTEWRELVENSNGPH